MGGVGCNEAGGQGGHGTGGNERDIADKAGEGGGQATR